MRRVIAFGFIVALGAGLSACGSSSARPTSPKAWRNAIVAAALAQRSFHWTYSDFFDLIGPAKRVGDVTADYGVEWETLPGGQTVQLRLVDHTLYVRGGNVAIDYLNLTPRHAPPSRIYLLGSSKPAREYAGQWISIPGSDKLYAHLAVDLTPASILHDASPAGKLKLDGRPSPGQRLLGLTGTNASWGEPGSSELKARATGTPLPVSFAWGAMTDFTRYRFSKWNESVNVQAPERAVPIAIVRKA